MAVCEELSRRVGVLLKHKRLILTTAESCTGGGISTEITEIAGSSAWFDRAFVTYSNEAKMEMLAVQENTLAQFGAVSEQTVSEMTQGALAHSRAQIAIAVSGIAGPDGGSRDKPVGTVCFSWQSSSGWKKVETCHFSGSRAQVRDQTIYHALNTLHDSLLGEEI